MFKRKRTTFKSPRSADAYIPTACIKVDVTKLAKEINLINITQIHLFATEDALKYLHPPLPYPNSWLRFGHHPHSKARTHSANLPATHSRVLSLRGVRYVTGQFDEMGEVMGEVMGEGMMEEGT